MAATSDPLSSDIRNWFFRRFGADGGRPRSGSSGCSWSASRGVKDALPEQVEQNASYTPRIREIMEGSRLRDRSVAARRPVGRADRRVLVRDPENRFAPQAPLCTNLDREPVPIVPRFVRRWSVEVAFQEARAHLDVETQRQWSDKAIARTNPCLLALFSIVTLLASRLPARERTRVITATWYARPKPTFVDALAAVRYSIWREQAFCAASTSAPQTKTALRPAPPLGLRSMPSHLIGQSRA